MKRKFLSLLLVLSMVVSLMPMTISAFPSCELFIGGTNVTDCTHEISYWKADGGGYSNTGTDSDYDFSLSYNSGTESFTLTLNGVDIETSGEVYGIKCNASLDIILADGTENSINVINTMGVDVDKRITIQGNGSLAVTSGNYLGLVSEQSGIDIYSGTIVINGASGGIFAQEYVNIEGGAVTAVVTGSYGDSIYTNGTLSLPSRYRFKANTSESEPDTDYTYYPGTEFENSRDYKYVKIEGLKEVYIGSTMVSTTAGGVSYWMNNGEGGITSTGSDEDNYNAKYDNTSKTLTLNGLELTDRYNASGESFGIYSSGPLNIVLSDGTDNSINTVTENAIGINVKAEGDITVGGSGALSLYAKTNADEDSFTKGIYSYGDITVTGGAITVTAAETESINGLSAGGDITIEGGSVFIDANNALSNGFGISTSRGNITISGGTVIALTDNCISSSYGLNSYTGSIDITGGAVYATGNPGGAAIYANYGEITPSAPGDLYDKASVIMTDGENYIPTVLYNSDTIPEFDADNNVVFTGGCPFGYGDSWNTASDKVYGNFAATDHNYTWSAKYRPENEIFDLTLNEYDIASYPDSDRAISTNCGLNLMLKGGNTIGAEANPYDRGIYCANDMTVSAETGGSLDIFVAEAGINADSTVSFENGDISIITDDVGIHITNGDLTISGGNITITAGEVGIQTEGTCDVTVSGSETVMNITAGKEAVLDEFYGINCDDGMVIIDDATVSIEKPGRYGDGVWAESDIRISGDAQVKIVDWSKGDSVKCGLHSQEGNILIGGSSDVDIVSQSTGIYTRYGGSVYIGYEWDGTNYNPTGSPTVKINDEESIAAITPQINDDFIAGCYGIRANSDIRIAGGNIEVYTNDEDSYAIYTNNMLEITGGSVTAFGTEQALYAAGEGELITVNIPFYKHRTNDAAAVVPTTPFSYYPDTAFDASGIGNYKYVNIASTYAITKAESQNGSFTVKVDGVPVSAAGQGDTDTLAAGQGDTVTLAAVPEENYSFVSWSVYRTDDETVTCPVDNNAFTMPAYPVTIAAVFGATPAVNPTSLNYDLNAPAEITTTINWNTASSVTSITYSAASLSTPSDYSVSGNTLTIESTYIAELSPALSDEINFEITFDTGDTATLTVNVVESFIPVTGITGVPTTATVGTPLILAGTVAPTNAANQTITWSIADPGTTNATISGNTLTTTATGTVVVRATITNGLTSSSDYIQDFDIPVNTVPTATVTFYSKGAVYDTKTVNIGESIESTAWPANPTRSSYTFGGWFTGENGTGTKFTSVTQVDSSIILYAKWTYSGGGGNGRDSTPHLPQKTITVTETSSELFIDTAGMITAEANMDNAFSNSVEVKVTGIAEDVASFNLSVGDEVYPLDISLYIKGTNEKTEPADGYSVTISLPIPENLVDKRTSLLVLHKSDNGTVTSLNSRLVQKDGVWYLVFEATEFSPYALVVRNSGNYDESMGVPYYINANENKVFIGFAANGKYIAPEGVIVSLMQNDKDFTDLIGHWAASNIGFTTERELFFGTGGNKFSPDIGMTRAMFATVIGWLYERSFGEITSSDIHAFIDCDYGVYYGKYVDWAADNGIISGVGNSKFAPDILVTREQMAVILYSFADFLKVLPNELDTSLEYPDEASISSYAKNAVLYCQTTDIIVGRSGGVFAPQETATRAEVAIIIKQFIETVMK